jgi:RNA polymerase sigma-70 factor (ECF subfamily)
MLMVRNSADADDVVQNAFYKAYVALARGTPDTFRPWLLSIVANESRNFSQSSAAPGPARGDGGATGERSTVQFRGDRAGS